MPCSAKPLRKASTRCTLSLADRARRNAITGSFVGCAFAALGQTAEPAMTLMKSRRLSHLLSSGHGRVPTRMGHQEGVFHVRSGQKRTCAAQKSGPSYSKSGRVRCNWVCPLCAKSGHRVGHSITSSARSGVATPSRLFATPRPRPAPCSGTGWSRAPIPRPRRADGARRVCGQAQHSPLRGNISATKPRTPRPMAYSCRRACRAVPTPCPCHSGATMKAISARFVVEFRK